MIDIENKTAARRNAAHPMAQQLWIVNDPRAFLLGLPEELRTDPGFICDALGILSMSRNTSELARRVGMSRMGLRKALEHGANPQFATVVRIAAALGLTLELKAA